MANAAINEILEDFLLAQLTGFDEYFVLFRP